MKKTIVFGYILSNLRQLLGQSLPINDEPFQCGVTNLFGQYLGSSSGLGSCTYPCVNNQVGIFLGHANELLGRIGDNTVTGNSTNVRRGIQLDLLEYPNLDLSPAIYGLEVTGNLIDIAGSGIYVQSCAHIDVDENQILLAPTNFSGIYGVGLFSNTGKVLVANNLVYSNAVGMHDIGVSGIFVRTSPESIVLCNDLHSVGRCAVWDGDSRPSDFLSNTMRDAIDGLVWTNGGACGIQGNASLASDNTWLGVFGHSQTFATGASFGPDSKFYCRQSTAFWPTVNLPIIPVLGSANMSPFTVPIAGQSAAYCAKKDVTSDIGGAIKGVATNRLIGGILEEAAQYRIDDWALSTLLKDNSIINTDSIITNYFLSWGRTNLAAESNGNEFLELKDSTQSLQNMQMLSPTFSSEFNHKTVLSIRLAGHYLSSIEISQLTAIAIQCQALGGRGVNLARSILAAEGMLVWEDPECSAVKNFEPIAPDEQVKISAECWPNPSQGTFFVRFSKEGLLGNFKIVDGLGQVLSLKAFQYNGDVLEIDATKCVNGILLILAELKDGSQFSWRVIIAR